MSIRITQAFMLFAATHTWTDKVTSLDIDQYGVPSTYLHAWANKDENCTSYSTYKYLSDVFLRRVNKFNESLPGNGVYGFWAFEDGSKLMISTAVGYASRERLTLYQPETDGINEGQKHPATLVDLTNWPEFREEPVDNQAVAVAG